MKIKKSFLKRLREGMERTKKLEQEALENGKKLEEWKNSTDNNK